MNVEPSDIATPLLLVTSVLGTYLFLRQNTRGENNQKLSELTNLYGSKYRFRFHWFIPAAQLLPSAQFSEDEALEITKRYLIENGQPRKTAFPYKIIHFLDSNGKRLFSGTLSIEGSSLFVVILKVTKSATGRPRYEITRRIGAAT